MTTSRRILLAAWVCMFTGAVILFAVTTQQHQRVGQLAASTEQLNDVANKITTGIQHALDCPEGWGKGKPGCNISIGKCAGWGISGSGSGNILIGDYTAPPTPDTTGFINIGNQLCFWRTTGERAACPPPEPECKP